MDRQYIRQVIVQATKASFSTKGCRMENKSHTTDMIDAIADGVSHAVFDAIDPVVQANKELAKRVETIAEAVARIFEEQVLHEKPEPREWVEVVVWTCYCGWKNAGGSDCTVCGRRPHP